MRPSTARLQTRLGPALSCATPCLLTLSLSLFLSACLDGGGKGGSSDATPIYCDGSEESTWADNPEAEVDYVVDCALTVTGGLEILEGTVITFGPSGLITVDGGKLIVSGTAEAPVVMRPTDPAVPWPGLSFFGSNESSLDHVQINGAGALTPIASASVVVGDPAYAEGNVSIRDCVIDGGDGFGLYLGMGKLPAFEGNKIKGNRAALSVNVGYIDQLNPNNALIGNGQDIVQLWSPPILDGHSQTWPVLDIPYAIGDVVTIAGENRLEAGVVVELSEDAVLIAGGDSEGAGGLVVEGSAEAPVVFRGASEAPWGAVVLTTGVHSFSQAAFSGGGASTSDPGLLSLDGDSGGSVSIRDCVFEGSAGYGLWLESDAVNEDVDTVNQFANNALGDVGRSWE